METAQGTVSHSQSTTRVSGGANDTAVSTTYITMFRLERQQVEFSSHAPLSVSDGDSVLVAGREYRGVLYADAIRNVTTGITNHSGVVGRVFLAVIILIIGLVAVFFLTRSFGPPAALSYLLFIAGAAYLCWRASQTSNALRHVRDTVP